MTDCAVIGGGVAGLSAAVKLTERGRSVALFEVRPHAGGRAYSFRDSQTGEKIDNGQHLLMGCYTELLSFMQTIGTRTRLTPIRRMRVPFLSPGGAAVELKAAPLPWPLDALSAFLGFTGLPFGKRLSLLRVVTRAAMLRKANMRVLDSMTVEAWLQECGQSPEAITRLWEPIVLATMNAHVRECSAYGFAVVLKQAFLAGKEASTFLVPDTDLSALLVEPALDYIQKNGGRVFSHTPICEIESSGDGYAIRSANDTHYARSVICAVPPRAFAALAEHSPPLAHAGINAEAFVPSLILSAHVWTKKEISNERMTGFYDTTIQWLFPRGRSWDGLWRYAVVISAANDNADISNDALRETVTRELCALYPHIQPEDIMRIKCVRERDATFLPLPGMETQRPAVSAPGGGVFLAGDWTNTGLPSTLEGAARSGHTAADAAESFLKAQSTGARNRE